LKRLGHARSEGGIKNIRLQSSEGGIIIVAGRIIIETNYMKI